MTGRKIINGLRDAIDGAIARVTIDGVTWVRRDVQWPAWQPIETAPMHTPLLVWHPGLGMGGWNVMRFDGREWRETANDGRALKDGYEPSHWLPLPQSPEVT